MKKINFVLTAVAAIATVSCVKEIAVENTPVNLIPMTFTAGSDNVDTKIALQEDQLTLHWENTDQIKVFDNSGTDLPAFTTTGSGASVDFTGQVASETGPFYALYPYQKDATFGLDADENNRPTIYAEVPTVQNAVAGNVPSNAFIAVAKSDDSNNFSFSSICGYIKFTLNQDNVESITFSGNNNESLTGKIKIYFGEDGTPKQTYVSGGVRPTVTLVGDLKNGETYYAAVRGSSFTKGISVSLLYKDGTRSHITSTVAPPNGLSENCVMKLATPATYNTEFPADNFIAYIHGYDLDVPTGATYSEVKLVDAKSNPGDLYKYMKGDKDRIIFVSGSDTIKITENTSLKKHIAVINRYKGERPAVKMTKYFRTVDGTFLMRNITVDASGLAENYLFNHASSTKDYGEFIIDGCWFKGLSKKFWQNAEKHAYRYAKFIIKNNRFEVTANDITIFNFYRPIKSADFEITNNVFYGAADENGDEKSYTGFKIIHHSVTSGVNGLELDNIILNNTTFVNLYFNKQGFVSANHIKKATVKNNLLYMPKYHDYAVSSGKLQYWGLMFAYGRVSWSDDGKAQYGKYECYATAAATEITEATAGEGANPNFYPAQGNVDIQYNTTYQEVVQAADGKKYYPKATWLDLKQVNGVFCTKGSMYNKVANPTAVTDPVFTEKDFAKGIFTQAADYTTRGAKITE